MKFRARSGDRIVAMSPTPGTAERYARAIGARARYLTQPHAEAWASGDRPDALRGVAADVIDVVVVAADLQWALVRLLVDELLDHAAGGALPVRLVLVGRPARLPLVSGGIARTIQAHGIPIVRLDPRGRYPAYRSDP